MSFFNSEVVRAEMTEIAELQEQIYGNVFKFPTMTRDKKIEHVELLERLIKVQQILYTRLSLSDDPKAVEMKSKIMESASQMGLDSNIDMNVVFKNMNSMLEVMKEYIDKTGSDM